MGHRPPPPPPIQHTTYTKHLYQYNKNYVGVWTCIKDGGDVAEAKKPSKI